MSNNKTFLQEFFSFLKDRKAWWLIPTVVLLVLASAVVILGQSSVISPFIYALF